MKQIIYQDKKIFYRTEGKGNPVMLIHGFAEDCNIWKHQIEKLKESFYVIIPDLPGSGKSEMIGSGATIENYAEAIKEIVDAETKYDDQKKITIIGHSMGGYIALAFAEKYPDLLNGLGLFHSTAYADDEVKKETRRKGIEFIKNNGVELFLKSTTPNLFSNITKKDQPKLLQNLIGEYKNFSSASLIQYYNAMIQRPDRTLVLRKLKIPILFIIGKTDKAVLLQSSLEQCYLSSISYINLLENSAHMGIWEEATRANKLLIQFLFHIWHMQKDNN